MTVAIAITTNAIAAHIPIYNVYTAIDGFPAIAGEKYRVQRNT